MLIFPNPSAPRSSQRPSLLSSSSYPPSPTQNNLRQTPNLRRIEVEEFRFPLTIFKRSIHILEKEPTFMALRIAQAVLVDLESVLALMREMQGSDPWSEPFLETTVRASLTELLTNPFYGLVYLVSDGGQPIAYLAICFDYSLEYGGKGAWIDELFVESSHRGQGIGTELLKLAERASFEHGAQFLHLEVTHGNSAIELYRRRGFVDHERYLMTKRLHP